MFTLFLTLLGLSFCIGALALAPYIGGVVMLGFLMWLVKALIKKDKDKDKD